MAIPTSNLSSTGLSNPINLKDGTSILQPGHPPGSTGRGRPRGVLLAWNSPGHQMMVSGSVCGVASDIPGWLFAPMLDFDHSGDPKPGGGDAFESLEYLTKAEDFTFANAAGKCHIDVPGGQIIHFMRDAYQAERTLMSFRWSTSSVMSPRARNCCRRTSGFISIIRSEIRCSRPRLPLPGSANGLLRRCTRCRTHSRKATWNGTINWW